MRTSYWLVLEAVRKRLQNSAICTYACKTLCRPAFKTSSIPVCRRLTDACKVSCRRKFVISRRLQNLHTDVLLMPVRRHGDVGVNSRRLQVVMTLPSRQIMSETSVKIAKKTSIRPGPSWFTSALSLCPRAR